jgi:hypothetical protein
MNHNKLLNQIHNTNINYNNNLINNSSFNNNKAEQFKKMKQMEQLRKIKMIQQMQNKIKKYTKNLLEPIKVKENNNEVLKKYNNLKIIKDNEKKNKQLLDSSGLEMKINNLPYKQIINDDKHKNDYKKNYNKNTFTYDIIVHKVTDKDKDITTFEKELKLKKQKIKSHNNILEKIYTDEKKEEHYKKFEYRKTYVYKDFTETSTDHNELKQENIKNYEKQQKEWESDNINLNNTISQLEDTGMLTENEKQQAINLLDKK